MAGLGAAINTGNVGRGSSVAVIGCGGVGAAAVAGSGEHGPGDGGCAHSPAADHGDRAAAPDVAGVDGRTQSCHDPATEQADSRCTRGRVDLGALTRGDEGLLCERPDPQGRRQLGAVLQRHLLRRVVGGEAVPRLTAVAGTAGAAHRPPVQDDEVAWRDARDVRADRLDDTRGLVAEQEGEIVVDAPLAVVQVGVADPAGLHGDQGLARAGVGNVDRGELDGLALGERDHGLDLVHLGPSWEWDAEPCTRHSPGVAQRFSRCGLKVASRLPVTSSRSSWVSGRGCPSFSKEISIVQAPSRNITP